MNSLIRKILDKRGMPILASLFVVLYVAETVAVLRVRTEKRSRRAVINSIVAVPGFLILRLLLVPAMVRIAVRNRTYGYGITNLFKNNIVLRTIVGFLLLDYGNYLWHILNHRIPLLWRFHLVHHTDRDLDVTTAIRFHAGEMMSSVFARGLTVLVTGVSPRLVLVYEIFFEAATLFHHSNWRLPLQLEKNLNKVFVTPRMHGIHHSEIPSETGSNYSVIFSIWDQIHRTVNLNKPQQSINIGVASYAQQLTVPELLKLPFTKMKQSQISQHLVDDSEKTFYNHKRTRKPKLGLGFPLW
jgi:sterol desaturase/sphingolipid hydroxylase (fatty acid hydroxylase superfamily)